MKKAQIIGLVLCFWACTESEQYHDSLFELLPEKKTNITFVNSLSEKKLNIIEYAYYYNGGGVAVGDLDNNGLADIFLTANEVSNKLYRNLGNLEFEDITEQAGVGGFGGWSTGVTMADVNNDGYLDIYVCQVGNYKGLEGVNQLFINNGDLTFTESAKKYGLDFVGFSTQAAFFDYDRDGDLDMYLLNHSVHSVRSYGTAALRKDKDVKAGDRLYKNLLVEGSAGFEDVTVEAGIYSSQIGYGLGVSVADMNGDQWQDIYISNDFHENDYLYYNNGDGTFSEQLENLIGHTSRYSMGNAIGDINGDNLPDIITLDMLPDDPEILQKSAGEDRQEVSDIKQEYGYGHQFVRNAYQLNRGNGKFSEIAQLSGIHATDWSWSPLIEDLDNDGNNDVYITNGIYKRPNDLDYIQYIGNLTDMKQASVNENSLNKKMIDQMPTLKVSNYAYRNLNNYKFENATANWGLSEPSYSNGAAAADLDNDGDLDLIVNNANQKSFVYENKGIDLNKNNYLQIELRGKQSNSFGIGARVTIFKNGIGKSKEIALTRGFQSSSVPVAHFGLGQWNKIDSLLVLWPSGISQIERDITINQRMVIQENENEVTRAREKTMADPAGISSQSIKLSPPYKHAENLEFRDYRREYLIPYKLSTEGPGLAVGDVNKDGLEDFFVGGARNQSGTIYLQQKDGSFIKKDQVWEREHAAFEDVAAAFFDAEGDGDLDMYVASGGNEDPIGSPLLQDRLYLNDGAGNFELSKAPLPHISNNSAVVKAADIDEDGDFDLFIGSRSVSGNYGMSADQFVLENDGTGQFNVIFQDAVGMVTDAEWFDLDNDGDLDLALAGDWMPITIVKNKQSKFERLGGDNGLADTHGWWRSVEITDINGDGVPDIVAGNVGENHKVIPTVNQPLTLYLNDFDNNGKSDPVIFYYKSGRLIPLFGKDLLTKQMSFLNKKFNTYEKYAGVSNPTELFDEEAISRSTKKQANTFKTSIYLNNGSGKFEEVDLPNEVQFSTINDVVTSDFDGDGHQDILLVGNFFGNTVELGRSDAQSSILLLKDSSGYKIILPDTDHFSEYRKLGMIKIKNIDYIILTRNNDTIQFIESGNLITNLTL